MRKTWKRFASIGLTGALAVSVAAGCSGNKQETQSQQSADPKAKQEPVVIDWLGYNSYGQPDPATPIVKMVQEKFNAKFNFWFIDAQKWDDNLNVKLAAGDMPDVLKISSKANIARYVNQGILTPIAEETIRKLAPTYAKFLDDNYKEAWDSVKYDGKIYAIPTTNLNALYPTVVVWRQDWLRNVGITKLPETLQEYEQALTKFRNEDPDKNGKKDTYGLSDYVLPNILGAFGYPGIINFKSAAKGDASQVLLYTKKDGKIVLAAAQPEMKDALALLQKWYKDGLIDPEFLTSENTAGNWAETQAFYNNRIGLTGGSMFYHWRNEMNPAIPDDKGGAIYKLFKQAQPNGEITLGKPAVGPKGQSGTVQWDTTSWPVGVTTKAAKDPRKLETLLKMIEATVTDRDYYNNITYGMKDVTWKIENDKFVSIPVAGENAASGNTLGKLVFNAGVTYDPFQKFADSFNYQYADKMAKNKGYKPLFVPVVDAFTKYSATLTKLTVESYFKIITGEASVDSFDEYVKKFKANGGDEVEKAANEAYSKMVNK